MNRIQTLVLALVLLMPCAAMAADEPPMALVSIYHVAPGKQMDFIKWMQAREAVAREAGAPDSMWYVHTEGDNWDYLVVSPQTSDAMDKKIDEMSKKRGLATGFKASLEFRQVMLNHTDTYAVGPVTADWLVKNANQ